MESSSLSTRLGNGKSLKEVRYFLLNTSTFFVLFLVLFSPVVLSGRLIAPEDGLDQNLAFFYGTRDLWTPLIMSGYPLLADPQAQFFYPLSYLFLLLPAGWNLYILSGYVISASALAQYLKLITGSAYSAFIGGLIFSMSGYLISEVNHIHVVHCACWTVCLLLAIECFTRKTNPLNFAFMILCVTMGVFAGHMQTMAYSIAMLGIYAILRSANLDKKVRYLCLCFAAIILGLGLAAMQIIPTFELTRLTDRASFSFSDFCSYSMHPLELFGIFMPLLLGGGDVTYFGNFLCRPYLMYSGLATLILSASIAAHSKRTLVGTFWLVIGSVAFLLSLGDGTPLASILYKFPVFNSFRALYRCLSLSSLSLAVLAGMALALIESKSIRLKTLALGWFNVLLLFLMFTYLIFSSAELLKKQASVFGIHNFSLSPLANWSTAAPCIILLLTTLILLSFYKAMEAGNSKAKFAAKLSLAMLVLADLSSYALQGQWRSSSPSAEVLRQPSTAEKYVPKALASHGRILTVRGRSASLDELKPNLCRLWNVPSASGYEPLILQRYKELLNMTEGGFLAVPWTYEQADRSFELMSIKYALTEKGDSRLEKLNNPMAPKWIHIEDKGTASVHQNLFCLPRCFLVREVAILPKKQVLQTIKTSKFPDNSLFDPRTTALVEQVEDGACVNYLQNDDILMLAGTVKENQCSLALLALPNNEGKEHNAPAQISAEAEQVEIVSEGNCQVDIRTKCIKPRLLVLTDILYPGWEAVVDQKPQPIIRSNYVARGVVLQEGTHAVTFRYRPGSFYLGLIISVLSGLSIISICFFWLMHRKSTAENSISEETKPC